MYLNGITSKFVGSVYKISETVKVNNKDVTNVIICTSEGYNDKRHCLYVETSFWGNDATSIKKYPKGHLLFVEGLMQAIPYTDKDNNPAVNLSLSVSMWQSLQKLDNSGKVDMPPTNKPASTNTDDKSKRKMTPDEKALYDSLRAKFSSGKYSGKTVSEVLTVDASYIYKVATTCQNEQWKRACTLAYNYYYERQKKEADNKEKPQEQQKPASTGHIDGVKNNYIPQYDENVPDGDLPF